MVRPRPNKPYGGLGTHSDALAYAQDYSTVRVISFALSLVRVPLGDLVNAVGVALAGAVFVLLVVVAKACWTLGQL